MNFTRLWGVFFVLMTSNFIIRYFLRKKGVESGKVGLLTKIIIASLPFFLFRMWSNDMIPIEYKIINTLIACCSFGAAIAYLHIAWKGNKEAKKMIEEETRK